VAATGLPASLADHLDHAPPDLRRVDLHLPQDACRRVVLVEQPEQHVFGPDVAVTKQASLLQSQHHRATSGITETLEHPGPPRLGR
jgi:hypothetical protein